MIEFQIFWAVYCELGLSLTSDWPRIQLEGEIHVREYFARIIADSANSVKMSITEIRVFRIMNLDRPGKPG